MKNSLSYLAIAIVIFLCEMGLFMLDYKSESLSDVLEFREIPAFIIYFVPTFLLSIYFFSTFWKNQQPSIQVVYSLLLSIPIGFTLVAVILRLLMA